MKCSRNELTALMYKAAIGSGCATAVADEIARAACSLQCLDYPGVELLLDALDARKSVLDNSVPEKIQVQFSTEESLFSTVTVAQDGPSVFDVVHAQSEVEQHALPLFSIDIPLLLVGLAVQRSAELQACYKIRYSNGAIALIGRKGVSVEGEIPDQSCDGELKVVTGEETFSNLRTTLAPESAVDVDDLLWNRCKLLAEFTYVPSTEASRLAGAGAGLTDND